MFLKFLRLSNKHIKKLIYLCAKDSRKNMHYFFASLTEALLGRSGTFFWDNT
jgi:hypothetical protein